VKNSSHLLTLSYVFPTSVSPPSFSTSFAFRRASDQHSHLLFQSEKSWPALRPCLCTIADEMNTRNSHKPFDNSTPGSLARPPYPLLHSLSFSVILPYGWCASSSTQFGPFFKQLNSLTNSATARPKLHANPGSHLTRRTVVGCTTRFSSSVSYTHGCDREKVELWTILLSTPPVTTIHSDQVFLQRNTTLATRIIRIPTPFSTCMMISARTSFYRSIFCECGSRILSPFADSMATPVEGTEMTGRHHSARSIGCVAVPDTSMELRKRHLQSQKRAMPLLALGRFLRSIGSIMLIAS
jgi:hypothetical protein